MTLAVGAKVEHPFVVDEAAMRAFSALSGDKSSSREAQCSTARRSRAGPGARRDPSGGVGASGAARSRRAVIHPRPEGERPDEETHIVLGVRAVVWGTHHTTLRLRRV